MAFRRERPKSAELYTNFGRLGRLRKPEWDTVRVSDEFYYFR
jgi:hypothetical protein